MEEILQAFSNPLAPAILAIAAFAVMLAALIALLRNAMARESALSEQLEDVQRTLNSHLEEARGESEEQARRNREELSGNLRGMGDSVTKIMGEMARTQQTQLDAFAVRLGEMSRADEQRMEGMRNTVEGRLAAYEDRMDRIGDILDSKLSQNEQRMDLLRAGIESRMESMQRDNNVRLQQINHTVDEQLGGALDRRLSERFQAVSDRLDMVYQGLGEMQTLASGVGDLKRVLSDVRARGLVGEIQLGALLDEMLSPSQYVKKPRVGANGATVSYAVRLPGSMPDGQECLLPIDASFPRETYDALMDAARLGDKKRCERLDGELAEQVESAARRLAEECVNPPTTTDFAVLFLGSEGLYAEVLRQGALAERLQRELHVTLAGPGTLSALLNSLQMGFRTLDIERRSREVWALLGAVRGEFGGFAEALARTQKRIRQASESIEEAARKSRTIQKKLKRVEALDDNQREALLTDDTAEDELYHNSDWD